MYDVCICKYKFWMVVYGFRCGVRLCSTRHIGVTGAIKTNKEGRLFSTASTSSNVCKDNIKRTVTAVESGCAALNWQVLQPNVA